MLILLLIAVVLAYPIPKYYDLVLIRCGQDGFPRNPNCYNFTWSISDIESMSDWGKQFVLASDCNLTKRDHINQTNIVPYLQPIEGQLNKHWYTCGDCGGNCTSSNPIGWFLAWANEGVCSNWTIPEYFTNGLLMFTEAASQNFHDCCNDQISVCHIPYTPDLKFISCYWPANDWQFRKR